MANSSYLDLVTRMKGKTMAIKAQRPIKPSGPMVKSTNRPNAKCFFEFSYMDLS